MEAAVLNDLRKRCFSTDPASGDFQKNMKFLSSFDRNIAARKKKVIERLNSEPHWENWKIANKIHGTLSLYGKLQTTDPSYALFIGRTQQLYFSMWHDIIQGLDANYDVKNIYYVQLHERSAYSVRDFSKLSTTHIIFCARVGEYDQRNDIMKEGFLYGLVLEKKCRARQELFNSMRMNLSPQLKENDIFTKREFEGCVKGYENLAERLKELELKQEQLWKMDSFSDLKKVFRDVPVDSVFYIGLSTYTTEDQLSASARHHVRKGKIAWLEGEDTEVKKYIFEEVKRFYYHVNREDDKDVTEKALITYASQLNVKLFNQRMGNEGGDILYVVWYREMQVPEYFFEVAAQKLIDPSLYIH